MGFRGEALFCLSNLSGSLIVATRTADQELAQKLTFRRDGSLDASSVCEMPRKIGTTVAVVRLLEALPVRRADMIRRITSQRGRLMKMMVGYAIFSVGVRINLMDMIVSGGNCRESTLLATSFNSTSIEETISSVLGSKFLLSLCSVCLDLALAWATNEESNTNDDKKKPKWKVEGLISKALHTRDRGAKDAQFFSINGRPVDIPKVSKLLNEVWRTFGGQKRPSCVLQFTLPNNAFDINLSPDKREVMLTQEKEICDLIQQGVTKLWASQTEGKFTQNPISGQENTFQREAGDDHATPAAGDFDSPRFNRRYAFSHDFSKAKMQHEFDDGRNTGRAFKGTATEPEVETIRGTPVDESTTDIEEKKQDLPTHTEEPVAERRKVSTSTKPISAEKPTAILSTVTPSPVNANLTETTDQMISAQLGIDQIIPPQLGFDKVISPQLGTDKIISPQLGKSTDAERHQWNRAQNSFNSPGSAGLEEEIKSVQKMNFDQFRAPLASESSTSSSTTSKTQSLEKFGFQVTREERSVSKTLPVKRLAPSKVNETSLAPKRQKRRVAQSSTEDQNVPADTDSADGIEERAMDEEKEIPSSTQVGTESSSTVVWESFKGTSDVIQSALHERLAMRDRKRSFQNTSRATPFPNAEDEPSQVKGGAKQATGDTLTLSKEDFSSMTVIGQFNLGFILARSQDNHLWILDQHACDEKFNFEKLCAETVIHEQKLIAPLPLELSPSEETCVMDHLDIFEKNGFRFKYDSDKAPRHRLALTALPHSGARDGRKAVQFGKEDVSALCAILGADGSGSSYDTGAGGGTGADGSGMYGNNAVRRYAGGAGAGDTADKIIARLPKAIAMFASRACRGSIMIGKPLSIKEMDHIVTRLEDVDNPWSCAHGRPAICHVGNVAHLMLEDEKKAAGHIAGPTVTVMSQDVDEDS